jgi:hypothetical protein
MVTRTAKVFSAIPVINKLSHLSIPRQGQLDVRLCRGERGSNAVTPKRREIHHRTR